MGLSRGEGEDIRKKKGCSCLERKTEFPRGEKDIFLGKGVWVHFSGRDA